MDIVIANDTERDDLFAEIYHGDVQWADVINDSSTGRLILVEMWTPAPGAATSSIWKTRKKRSSRRNVA